MIGMLDAHDLNDGLAKHLARADVNARVLVKTHGLLAMTIKEAFSELRLISAGARTAQPGAHAILSPSISYSDQQWVVAWDAFEIEMGLADQPYIEVRHIKLGRGGRLAEHSHRIYSRINERGGVIRFPHIAPRIEKASRMAEFANGEALIGGRWNLAVLNRLDAEGNSALAAAMRAAGLEERERPEATSRAERMSSERVADVSADEAKRLIFFAWQNSQTGLELQQRLAEHGFRLCIGDAGRAMIMTPKGVLYRLAAAVASGSKAAGFKGSIKAADIHQRVALLDLQSVEAVGRFLIETPPIDGWRSITGAERSTLNLADPARSQNAKPITDLAENSAPFAADATSLPKFTQNEVQAPAVEIPFKSVFSTAERQEAEAFFASMKSLNSQWVVGGTPTTEPKAIKNEEAKKQIQPADYRPLPNLKNRIRIDGQARAASFKADIAKVEREFGAIIQWVKQKGLDQVEIKLRDGAIVNATAMRIWTNTKSDNAIDVMVSSAKLRGFTNIKVTAENNTLSVSIAKKLIMEGLQLAEPALASNAKMGISSDFDALEKEWHKAFDNYWSDRTLENLAVVEANIARLQPAIAAFKLVLPRSSTQLLQQIETMGRLAEQRRHDEELEAELLLPSIASESLQII